MICTPHTPSKTHQKHLQTSSFYFQKQVIFPQLLLGFYHDFLQPSHVVPYLQRPPNLSPSTPLSRAKSQNLLYRCRRLFPRPKVGFGERGATTIRPSWDDHEPPWFSMKNWLKNDFWLWKKYPHKMSKILENLDGRFFLRWLTPIDCQKMWLQQKNAPAKTSHVQLTRGVD